MKFLTRKSVLYALVGASLSATLSACAPLLVGGAVMVVTDRRTSGAQVEDEGIELRGVLRVKDAVGERGHINISSYNRQVLVTGEVPGARDKELVEQVLSGVENVRHVVNELAVMPVSSLTQRSNDALITTRVKAAFVDTVGLSANSFRVVTERGVTYLMGRVTQSEAARATEVTRNTGGVQKVVRIFEYLSDEDLRHLVSPPDTAPAATKTP